MTFQVCHELMQFVPAFHTLSLIVLVECKVFFTTKRIGRLDQGPLLSQLAGRATGPKVVILRGDSKGYTTYGDLLTQGSRVDPDQLHHAEMKVVPHLVCNLQFTSGTTGLPKAAMLTHQ